MALSFETAAYGAVVVVGVVLFSIGTPAERASQASVTVTPASHSARPTSGVSGNGVTLQSVSVEFPQQQFQFFWWRRGGGNYQQLHRVPFARHGIEPAGTDACSLAGQSRAHADELQGAGCGRRHSRDCRLSGGYQGREVGRPANRPNLGSSPIVMQTEVDIYDVPSLLSGRSWSAGPGVRWDMVSE